MKGFIVNTGWEPYEITEIEYKRETEHYIYIDKRKRQKYNSINAFFNTEQEAITHREQVLKAKIREQKALINNANRKIAELINICKCYDIKLED